MRLRSGRARGRADTSGTTTSETGTSATSAGRAAGSTASPRSRRGRIALSLGGAVAGSAAFLSVAIPAQVPGSGVVVRHIDEAFTRLTGRTSVTVPPGTPSARAFAGVPAVGALFPAGSVTTGSTTGLDAGGGHFCTASVVASPAGDLAVTAAHCVAGVSSSMVFVPGYHDGIAPYGTWLVTRVFTTPAWQSSQDADDDVAFLRLGPSPSGVPVQSVTGAERLGTTGSGHSLVQVIGYPEDSDEPVSCVNWTQAYGTTQLQFDCGGYPDGTSGGPFLADVNPKSGEGTVTGVIGGYQQGGDTDAISYSAVFGPAVLSLYADAVAGS
jgi:V8-like Glu-specific endopeptidase